MMTSNSPVESAAAKAELTSFDMGTQNDDIWLSSQNTSAKKAEPTSFHIGTQHDDI